MMKSEKNKKIFHKIWKFVEKELPLLLYFKYPL